jgi:hypothetical protein
MANKGQNQIIVDLKRKDTSDTWNKLVAGIPKWQIRDHYKVLWMAHVLQPQLEGRYTFFRYFFEDDKKGTIKRHYPDSNRFIHITSWTDLEEQIRLHALEIVPELAKIGEPNYTRRAFIELDTHNVPGAFVQEVVGSILSLTGNTIDSPFVEFRDTGGKGIHVYIDIMKNNQPAKWSWSFARKWGGALRERLQQRYPKIIELNIQKAKAAYTRKKPFIFPDISSMKVHGGARAVGSIHPKTKKICTRITYLDIGKINFMER